MLLLGVQGLLAAEREDEVKELAGKLHQERMDSVWKGDMLQHLIHQQTDIRPDDVVVHCDANGTNYDYEAGDSRTHIHTWRISHTLAVLVHCCL